MAAARFQLPCMRGEHSQPLANGLRSTGAARSTLSGRHQAAPRHNFEKLSGEMLKLRQRHRGYLVAVGADGERAFRAASS